MAEYKEIHGTKIRNYTTDPDNPITGEVWYNDTTEVLKFQYPSVTTTGSWRTLNSINTARQGVRSSGSNTAAIVTGGNDGSLTGKNESYNGTNWTEVNDLNTARAQQGQTGTTNTAALAYAGMNSPISPYYTHVKNFGMEQMGQK